MFRILKVILISAILFTLSLVVVKSLKNSDDIPTEDVPTEIPTGPSDDILTEDDPSEIPTGPSNDIPTEDLEDNKDDVENIKLSDYELIF